MAAKDIKGATVQSVARALDIIEFFTNPTELSLTDIADRMEISKSSVLAMINTLTIYGYLEKTPDKKYRLGLRLFELGKQVESRMDYWEEARPFCRELAEKYQTSVHFATYTEGDVVYIGRVESEDSVVAYSQVGKRAPMYCTGTGKVILAYLPEEYTEKYVFSNPMEKLTENTITDHGEFLAELENIRRLGYSLERQEQKLGLECIAAPIFNYRGEPQFSLLLSFTYGTFQRLDIDTVARDVRNYTGKISARFGYTGEK